MQSACGLLPHPVSMAGDMARPGTSAQAAVRHNHASTMLRQGWDLKMYPRQVDDMYWQQRASQLYNMERMLMVLYLGMVFAIWFQVSSFVKEDRFFIELVIIIMALNLVGALFAMRYKKFYISWRTPVLTVSRLSQTMASIVCMVVLRGTQEESWRFDSQKVTFAVKLVGLSHNPFKIMDVFGMQASGSLCWRLLCACLDVELIWDGSLARMEALAAWLCHVSPAATLACGLLLCIQ